MSEPLWYYQQGTEAQGPIDEALIREKISQGLIQADTLVWREGLTNWVAARHTALASAFGMPGPSSDPWKTETPATAKALPSAMAAWLLAVIPLALIPLIPVESRLITFVGLGLYVALSVSDVKAIQASGREPSKAYWWAILLGGLGAPVYLYRRGTRIDNNRGYFALSLVSIAIYLVACFCLAYLGQ